MALVTRRSDEEREACRVAHEHLFYCEVNKYTPAEMVFVFCPECNRGWMERAADYKPKVVS